MANSGHRSANAWDVIVIGAGINGLVCAAYLAKAGRRTLVLEAREIAGGCAAMSELAPGFRVPTLAHSTGPLRRDVVRELELARKLVFLPSPVDLTALDPNGGALVLHADRGRTAEALRTRSAADAAAWLPFAGSRDAVARVIASLLPITPPSPDTPTGRDGWHLLQTARAFRKLPREDAYRVLRWTPMPAADIVMEFFQGDLLGAVLAADGIFGSMMGPWSAGSGLGMLLSAANEWSGHPGSRFVEGGPARVAEALTDIVREAGGIVQTGARVAQLATRDARVTGVVLANGDELQASTIVSAIDPKRTLLTMCDPVELAPELQWRLRNYRVRGTTAKVNLALSALPAFAAVDRDALSGRVRIGPDLDYLEQAYDHAKYGRVSSQPWIELTIPSLLDPGLAPPGGHVLSAYVQFAPHDLRGRDWAEERDRLGRDVLRVLEQYAPGLGALVEAQQVITPVDLEQEWGLSGGHIFHGELALDQLFIARPLLGWAQYRTPLEGLYLCGSGTHPGTGLTGGSGANAAREILRG